MRTKSPTARVALQRLANKTASKLSRKDADALLGAVDSLLFRADTWFSDYAPFQNEGTFPVRFLRWLENVDAPRERAALVRLAEMLLYLDSRAVRALYAESYRLHIVPWLLHGELRPSQELSSIYWDLALDALASSIMYSVTDSFHWDTFRSENGIAGIPEPKILGKTKSQILATLGSKKFGDQKIIVVEDVVGSGDQVIRALEHLIQRRGATTRVLFVALVLVQGAEERIRKALGKDIDIRVVSTIQSSACVRPIAEPIGETRSHALIRALVKKTADRVMARNDARDDPPRDPFGYGGTGATVVFFRNTPNNSLPLIHHRAPAWEPLFRRIHHTGRTK